MAFAKFCSRRNWTFLNINLRKNFMCFGNVMASLMREIVLNYFPLSFPYALGRLKTFYCSSIPFKRSRLPFTDYVDPHIIRTTFEQFIWYFGLFDQHREPTGEKTYALIYRRMNSPRQLFSTHFSSHFQLLNARHYGGE